MVNDSLGTICNAHVVHADLSDYGALDENCLKLAELAATAVDFPKTGKMVTMPPQLRPKLYPDFMGKEDFQSYKSEKILGKLYRQIKDFYNTEVTPSPELQILPSVVPYDKDLEILDSASFLNDAWGCKLSYDRQLNGLLGQYKVSREEEIVTGHIWSMPKHGSKKQGELKERIKHAYSALRKDFRKVFDHLVTYHPIWVKKSLELQEPDRGCETVNLSFAWIAADYLARIKIRCRGIGAGNSREPIHTFGRYIADRILLIPVYVISFWLQGHSAIFQGLSWGESSLVAAASVENQHEGADAGKVDGCARQLIGKEKRLSLVWFPAAESKFTNLQCRNVASHLLAALVLCCKLRL
ncbi:hypothetical protein E3N88_17832 [Mikania micrantha]|uniref:RNA-dependent RNA polymerase n=1 Tax=Mikania micrantha TaxID=192012 RepID=A0A5N6NT62_9ASTR|nr:hypothetical protein E3N88_17832 [Mikania micrantha]